jgi:hypothetical protein
LSLPLGIDQEAYGNVGGACALSDFFSAPDDDDEKASEERL